jgi:TonB family protein
MSVVLYLAKLTLVSGILYSYYWTALRNKKFHLYNRFYLIITVIISLILPCINIPVSFYNSNAKILDIISVGEWEPAVVITPTQNWLQQFLTWQNIFFTFYIAVSGIMVYVFVKSIRYVIQISKKYSWEKIDDIKLFYTNEPESPFSIFKNIFWNNNLNITSEEGKQIFQHEIYHVRKKHSVEVLLMEIICCIFWFNPFYHLIKKEIKTIHEFLADEYASSGVDKFGYAELLVWQTINNKQISIINPFFHNQIKRRIAMITQLKNKRYNYLGRVMALPILFILFCAFGVKKINAHSPIVLQNILGNDDSVFHSVERYLIKHLRYPENSVKANYAATVNVKVTVDATGKCKTITPVEAIPVDTKYYGITVHSLSKFANSSSKPPVIEPGFNKNEFVPFKETVTKTLSEFKSDKPGNSEVTFYLKVTFKIEENNKTSSEFVKPMSSTGATSFVSPIIVDTIPLSDTISPVNISKLNPNDIKSIDVLKDGIIIIHLKNGEKLITKKVEFEKYDKEKENNTNEKSPNDIVFTKVDVEASYPGGYQGWEDYLIKSFHYPQEAVNKEIKGTIVVQYIVDKEGNVSDVKAISGTKKGGLREEAIRVIKNSGKWIPAMQNGHAVSAYKRQPIQFMLQDQ